MYICVYIVKMRKVRSKEGIEYFNYVNENLNKNCFFIVIFIIFFSKKFKNMFIYIIYDMILYCNKYLK